MAGRVRREATRTSPKVKKTTKAAPKVKKITNAAKTISKKPRQPTIPKGQPTLAAERREWLRELFPEAFADGNFAPDRIAASLGDSVEVGPERFTFSWAGKRDALRLLQMPSRAALVPQPKRSVNFEHSRNVFIDGENLETLKLLHRAYFGKVQMVYLDPPYNTGDDRIYQDDYSDPLKPYLVLTGQQTEAGDMLTSNPETSGRFHSSWLSMMYPRLFLARQLLSPTGVVWVSIDDVEAANLREVCNEIFGEENWVATFIWEKRTTRENRRVFSFNHDYVLCYARDKTQFQAARNLLPLSESVLARYANPDNDPRGDWQSVSLNVQAGHATTDQIYSITTPSGRVVPPPPGRAWSVIEPKMKELRADNRVWFGEHGNNVPRLKLFLSEAKEGLTPQTLWKASEVGTNDSAKKALIELFDGVSVFETPKPVELIKRMVQISTANDGVILDFFAGTSTTAQAVMEQNRADGGTRSFVCVQLPEPTKPESDAARAGYRTIAAIGEERIRRAIGRMAANEQRPTLLGPPEHEDLGCRVFTMRPTAFKLWRGVKDADAKSYLEQMALFTDRLTHDAKPLDVLWEIGLREGYPLTSRIERLDKPTTNAIWRMTDDCSARTFLACLDDKIEPRTVASLALSSGDVFVCRDSALTDELAANLALQCRLETI